MKIIENINSLNNNPAYNGRSHKIKSIITSIGTLGPKVISSTRHAPKCDGTICVCSTFRVASNLVTSWNKEFDFDFVVFTSDRLGAFDLTARRALADWALELAC